MISKKILFVLLTLGSLVLTVTSCVEDKNNSIRIPKLMATSCLDADCGTNGDCQNVEGTDQCVCDPGYHRENSGDLLSACISDCTGVSCGDNGACELISGTAECNCDPTYRWNIDPVSGFPIGKCVDECGDENSYGMALDCGGHGSCSTNAQGDPSCSCDIGYRPVLENANSDGEPPTCEGDCYYDPANPVDPYDSQSGTYTALDLCGESAGAGYCEVDLDKNLTQCHCNESFKLGSDDLSCVPVCDGIVCESGSCQFSDGAPHCSCGSGYRESTALTPYEGDPQSWMTVVNEDFYLVPKCVPETLSDLLYYPFDMINNPDYAGMADRDDTRYDAEDISISPVKDDLHVSGNLYRGAGVLGSSLFLEGTPDRYGVAESSDDLNPSGSFSVSFWFRPLDTQPQNTVIIMKEDQYGVGIGENGKLMFAFATDSSQWQWYQTAFDVVLDSWNLIALTWDGTDVSIVVVPEGGSLDSHSQTPGGTFESGNEPLMVGYTPDASMGVTGWIDELKLKNGAITSSQLLDEFNFVMTYYDGDSGTTHTDPCFNLVCPKDRICISDPTSSDPMPECVCDLGFAPNESGACEFVCGGYNCNNNGTCSADSNGDPECLCDIGFSGSYCDNKNFSDSQCEVGEVFDGTNCVSDTDLKLWYKFNDYGNRTVVDHSAPTSDDAFNGTIPSWADASWVSGVNGYGLDFEKGYVLTENRSGLTNDASINGQDKFSFIVWHRQPQFAYPKNEITDLVRGPEYGLSVVRDESDTYLLLTLCTQGTQEDQFHDYNGLDDGSCRSWSESVKGSDVDDLKEGHWNQIAFTYRDDGNAYLFVNGVETANFAIPFLFEPKGFMKPQGADTTLILTDGMMDDFFLYHRSLTDNEIAQNYRELPCGGIDCSGHGRCVQESIAPVCVCDEGYVGHLSFPFDCFENVEIDIVDENLRSCVKEHLRISTEDPILKKDMLYLQMLRCRSLDIEDLTGLEYALDLKMLDLNNNDISDVSSLKDLRKIEDFDISYNCVDTFPTFASKLIQIEGEGRQSPTYCANYDGCSGFTCDECNGFDCPEGARCFTSGGEPSCIASCDTIVCGLGEICDESGETAVCVSSCDEVNCGVYSDCVVEDDVAGCKCKEGYAALGNGSCSNVCAGESCSGHGVCKIDVVNRPFCQCDEGYRRYSDVDGERCVATCEPGEYEYNEFCVSGYASDDTSGSGMSSSEGEESSGGSQDCVVKADPDCDPESGDDCECMTAPELADCFDDFYIDSFCGSQHWVCTCPGIIKDLDINGNGVVDEGTEMDQVPVELRDKINEFMESEAETVTVAPTIYNENGVNSHEHLTTSLNYPEDDFEAMGTGATFNAVMYRDFAKEKQNNITGDDTTFFERWTEKTRKKPIDSCETYVYQKYGDFLKASAIMTRFSDKPFTQMQYIIDIPFFDRWMSDETTVDDSHLASQARKDELRTIEHIGGRNLYWRLLHLAIEQAEVSVEGAVKGHYHTNKGITKLTLLGSNSDSLDSSAASFGSVRTEERDLSLYGDLRDPGNSSFEGKITDFDQREQNFLVRGMLESTLLSYLMYRANLEIRYFEIVDWAEDKGTTLSAVKMSAKPMLEDYFSVDLDEMEDPTDEDMRIQTEVNMHQYLETDDAKILNFKMERGDLDDIESFAESVFSSIDTRIREVYEQSSYDYYCLVEHSTDTWTDCEWHPQEYLAAISGIVSISDIALENDYQTCLKITHNDPGFFTDDDTRETDLGSHTFRVPDVPDVIPDDPDEISDSDCDKVGDRILYTIPDDIVGTLYDTLIELRNYRHTTIFEEHSWAHLEDFFKLFPSWTGEYMVRLGRENRLKRVCAAKNAKKAMELRKRQQEAERQAAKTAADSMGDLVDMSEGAPKDGSGLSIGKFFSDYRRYGNSRAGINFSYIFGYHIGNAIIGWNDLQPAMYSEIEDFGNMKPKIATEYYRDMIASYVEYNSLAVDDMEGLMEKLPDEDPNFDANVAEVATSFDSCSSPDAIMTKMVAPVKETINELEYYQFMPLIDFLQISADEVIDQLATEILISILEESAYSVCVNTGNCPGAVEMRKELYRTPGNLAITSQSVSAIRSWIESGLSGVDASEWSETVDTELVNIHDVAVDLRFFLITDTDDQINAMIPEFSLSNMGINLTGFDVESGSDQFDQGLALDVNDFSASVSEGMDIDASYLKDSVDGSSGSHSISFDMMKNAVAQRISETAQSFDMLAGARDGGTCTLPVLDLSFIDPGHSVAAIDENTLPDYTFDTVADALIARVREIANGKLLTIPEAELIAHARAGVKVLNKNLELVELTNYLTTFYGEARLPGAKSNAVDKFNDNAQDNINMLELYQRYYIIDFEWAINIGLGLGPDQVKGGIGLQKKKARDKQKARLKEISQASGNDPANLTRKDMVKSVDTLPKYRSMAMMEDPGTEIKLVNVLFEKKKTFMVSIVPVTVGFGFSLIASIGVGTDMNFGYSDGFALGMQLGPIITSLGFLRAGVGFDIGGLVTVWAGIEGELVFVRFKAPLSAGLLLKPTIENGYPGAYLFLNSELRPRLTLLYGSISLFAEAKICIWRFCKWKSAKKKLVSFKPQVNKVFPNILPIKPLKVNLFSLSDLMSNYDDYIHQHED